MGLQQAIACVMLVSVLAISDRACSQASVLEQQGLSHLQVEGLLQELRRSKFASAAALAALVARPYLQPHMTFLIPSDAAIAHAALQFAPAAYPSLVKFHILQGDFHILPCVFSTYAHVPFHMSQPGLGIIDPHCKMLVSSRQKKLQDFLLIFA